MMIKIRRCFTAIVSDAYLRERFVGLGDKKWRWRGDGDSVITGQKFAKVVMQAFPQLQMHKITVCSCLSRWAQKETGKRIHKPRKPGDRVPQKHCKPRRNNGEVVMEPKERREREQELRITWAWVVWAVEEKGMPLDGPTDGVSRDVMGYSDPQYVRREIIPYPNCVPKRRHRKKLRAWVESFGYDWNTGPPIPSSKASSPNPPPTSSLNILGVIDAFLAFGEQMKREYTKAE